MFFLKLVARQVLQFFEGSCPNFSENASRVHVPPERAEVPPLQQRMNAMLQMDKLDIGRLKQASEQ
jgi:hypothetical protein